jgi:hypothetical protein
MTNCSTHSTSAIETFLFIRHTRGSFKHSTVVNHSVRSIWNKKIILLAEFFTEIIYIYISYCLILRLVCHSLHQDLCDFFNLVFNVQGHNDLVLTFNNLIIGRS